MNRELSYDFFEPGDFTALICVDNPKLQGQVFEGLTILNYKVHMGLFVEDIALKLRSNTYNVMIVYEKFGGHPLSSNPILEECFRIPSQERRKQFMPLLNRGLVRHKESYRSFNECLKMIGALR